MAARPHIAALERTEPARIQHKRIRARTDRWEDEADAFADWLERSRGELEGTAPVPLSPVPIDRTSWGEPLDPELASCADRNLGVPLAPELRRELEARLSVDLGDIRVHDDTDARALVRSIGAQAFTLGQDIFLGRSNDRALLAHELAHTLQQRGAPSLRVQGKIKHPKNDLDPLVDELIQGHFHSTNATAAAELIKVADELRKEGSFWNTFRADIEPATEEGAVKVSDVKKRTLELCMKINQDFRKRDVDLTAKTGLTDSVRNALAGLLTDYLRRAGEVSAAASVVEQFLWVKTFLPSDDVMAALSKGAVKTNAKAVLSQMPYAFPQFKAWPSKAVEALRMFLRLPPLESFDKDRAAISASLRVPLDKPKYLVFPPGADLHSERIDTTKPAAFNELAGQACHLVEYMHGQLAIILDEQASVIATARSDVSTGSLTRLWYFDVIQKATTWVDRLCISEHQASSALGDVLSPVAEDEQAFWKRAKESAEWGSSELRDKILARLAATGLSVDEAMLQESAALRALVDELAPGFKLAALAYLDLRKEPIASDPRRRQLDWLLASHKDRAAEFAKHIDTVVDPRIATELHKQLAKSPAPTDPTKSPASDAEALAWFAMTIEGARGRLRAIAALDNSVRGLEKQFVERIQIAYHLRVFAHDASGAGFAARRQDDVEPQQKGKREDAKSASGKTPFEVRDAAKDWAAIHERAALACRLEDIKTSVLILPQQVEPASESTFAQLNADFESIGQQTTFEGLAPFTARDVYDLVFHRYYQDLLAALGPELLAAEKAKQRTAADQWISGRAIEKAEKSARFPKRFYLPEADYVRFAGDPPGTFRELIAQHPTVRAWQATNVGSNEHAITRLEWSPALGTLWLWKMPAPAELVRNLYDVPILRGLVQLIKNRQRETFDEYVGTDSSGARTTRYAATVETLELAASIGKTITAPLAEAAAFDWYSELRSLVNVDQILGGGDPELRKEDAQEFRDLQAAVRNRGGQARKDAKGQHDDTLNRVNFALRKATTHDRLVAEEIIRQQLSRYDGSDLRTEQILSVALENIRVFRRSIRPLSRREVGIQIAAMMVSLAVDLKRIYGAQDFAWFFKAIDLPIGSNQSTGYSLLHEALDYIDELKKPARRTKDREPPTDSHSEGIFFDLAPTSTALEKFIETKRASLDEAITPMRENLIARQWDFGITGSVSNQAITSHLGSGGKVLGLKAVQRNEPDLSPEDQRKKATFPNLGIDVTIEEVLNDFVYLPGAGFRSQALGEGGAHAFYTPGHVFVAPNLVDKDGWEDPKKREKAAAREQMLGRDQAPPAAGEGLAIASNKPPINLVRVMLSFEGKPLLKDGQALTITSHDIGGGKPALVWLMHAIHGQVLQEKFANLARAIQGFGELLKFVASFHPVGRWVVAAGEILELINEVVNNPEFTKELARLRDDPVMILTSIADDFAERLTVDGMFKFLINGDFDAPAFAQKTTPKGKRKQTMEIGGKRSRIQRLLTRLWRLGSVVAMRLEHFQDGVQRPLRVIGANVARRPALSNALAWTGEHASDVLTGSAESLRLSMLKHPVAAPALELYLLQQERKRMKLPAQDASSELNAGITGFVGSYREALENAATFKLPDELIPLPDAVRALLELIHMIASRSKNKKVRAATKIYEIVEAGADQLGVMDYAMSFLGSKLKNTAMDPNVYWRDTLTQKLRGSIEDTIHAAANDVGELLKRAPLIGDVMKNESIAGPSANGITADVSTDPELNSIYESDETSQYIDQLKLEDSESDNQPSDAALRELPDFALQNLAPKDGGEPKGASPALSSDAASAHVAESATNAARTKTDGEPLPAPVRASAERKFGHGFGSVRLSQGPSAAFATFAHGADALTTGSHIQLRPDLSPSSGRGARVLDHELSHVLQKRAPLASGATSRSSSGLRIRSEEEAAADRMAERARRNTHGAPIAVEGAHRDGASPSVSKELLRTFLLRMASPEQGPKLAEAAERGHGADVSGPDALDGTVKANAKVLFEHVLKQINAGALIGKRDYLKGEAHSTVIKHFQKRLKPVSDLSASADVRDFLAANRQVSPRGKPQIKELQVKGFLSDLELYFAGRSGVIIEIANKGDLERNLHATPELHIEHLELFLVRKTVPESKAIWDAVVKNTWTERAKELASEAKLRSYVDHVEAVLQEDFGAPVPPVAESEDLSPEKAAEGTDNRAHGYTSAWDTGAKVLKLDDTFKARVEARIRPPAIGAQDMPPWKVYVGHERKAAPGTSSWQQAKGELTQSGVSFDNPERTAKIGLHLSTHSDLKDNYDLGHNGRNSHHITQYLLAEYFHNKKSFKPFPRDVPYAGVTRPQGKALVTAIAAGGKTIHVADTEAGRGGPMPALNLAASVHQMPLHVTPQADESGSLSQGAAIHEAFQAELVASTKKNDPVEADTWLSDNPSSTTAQKAVYDAVQATYGWIWNDQMRDQLRAVVPDAEAQYYLDQFTADDNAKARLASVNADKAPDRSEIAEAIKKRIEAAETHMKATLADPKLGWVLPK